jgi:benzoylformate decarboxylase
MKLGRDVVFDYLRDLGVRYIFGVPGTNEIPLIDGTSIQANDVAYIPCLHENIAVGAAAGYARASGRPGVVELHVTPGAAHGIGNLFNAHKSHVPLVVLCAQQHQELLLHEPLLASDLVQVARQYTKWAHEVRFPAELPLALQRAFKEALTPPMGPVFLSIPWEFTLAQVPDGPPRVTRIGSHFTGDRESVRSAANALAAAKNPVIVAGDGVGAASAWDELGWLAALIGAPVYTESLSSYMNFPNHADRWQGPLDTSQQGMQQAFAPHDVAFLCGFNSQAPVLVYRYADGPLIPDGVRQIYLHDDPWEIGKNGYGEVAILGDIKATLPLLSEDVAAHPELDKAAAAARNAELSRLAETRRAQIRDFSQAVTARPGSDPITGENVAIALARLQPEMNAPLLLADEAISDSKAFQTFPRYDDPISYLNSEGGSLGWTMPASLGLKLAVGTERTVVNAVGDGSALFYPHTWWTTRKFDIPVLYVITNNREYRTLQKGLKAIEQIYDWFPSGDPWYLELRQPPLSFADLAAPFGIAGACVSRLDELQDRLREGLKTVESGQPFVLDVHIDPEVSAGLTQPRLNILAASKENANDDAIDWTSSLGAP